MEFLVYIALAFVALTLVGALLLAPRCSLGFRPLLSGYTIILYVMLLYICLSAAVPIFFNNMTSFFFPSYSGPQKFLGTLIVNELGIVLFVGFYHFFSGRRIAYVSSRAGNLGGEPFFPAIAYACIAGGIALKLLYIQRFGGLNALLVARSPGVAASIGVSQQVEGASPYLIFLSMCADAAACWLVLEAGRTRKQFFFHLLLVGGVLGATFLVTPKRQMLIMPVLSLLVGFSIYAKPLRLSQAPLFLTGAVSFSMLTLVGRIFLPAYAAGITVINLAQLDVVRRFAIRLLSADLAFFDATAVAIYGRQAILAKFGGWWEAMYRPNIEALFYAIPRFIWPGKPRNLVDISTALQSIIAGIPLDRMDGGFGIGLIGISWFYGEVIGLAVGMGVLAMAAVLVDRFLAKMDYASPGRILIFAVSATMLFHLYRQGTLGWVFLNFFQTGLVFWLTVILLTHAANVRRTRSPIPLPSV